MREKRISWNVFAQAVYTIALPIAFQNLMSALVSASDAMMLGMVNQDSLSAVSLAAQVQFVLSLFWAALTIGTTILAAQYWGKNDRLSVEKILAIVLKYSFVISFLFFAAAALCPQALMRIFTNDVTLIALGGIAYTIGAVIYMIKKPDLSKQWGFHELFHLFILLGSFFHFIAVLTYILL